MFNLHKNCMSLIIHDGVRSLLTQEINLMRQEINLVEKENKKLKEILDRYNVPWQEYLK